MQFWKKLLTVALMSLSGSALSLNLSLTFDDLPSTGLHAKGINDKKVASMLTYALEQEQLKGIYGFVNGQHGSSPDQRAALNMWLNKGQNFGNHTYSHLNLAAVGTSAFLQDIAKNDLFLNNITSQNYKYFRYPYLVAGSDFAQLQAVRNYLKAHGYEIVSATMDFDDWAWNNAYVRCTDEGNQAAVAYLKVSYLKNAINALYAYSSLANSAVGRNIQFILLLHFNNFTAVMLQDLLKAYQANKVNFIPLQEALADPVYHLAYTLNHDKPNHDVFIQARATFKTPGSHLFNFYKQDFLSSLRLINLNLCKSDYNSASQLKTAWQNLQNLQAKYNSLVASTFTKAKAVEPTVLLKP